MIYRLKELKGDTIAVPQLVFSKLGIAEEYNVRVALYVVVHSEDLFLLGGIRAAVRVRHGALARGKPVAQPGLVAAVIILAQKVVQQGNKDHGAARPFRQKARPFAQSILL